MARLNNAITKDFLNDILPVYGTSARQRKPTWDDSQKMFIYDEWESANGNHYYCGIRFCDRFAVVEKVGMYHFCTYIDSLEVYAFNGRKMQLIQKKDYAGQFRKNEFIRAETENMVINFLKGVLKMNRVSMPEDKLQEEAKVMVDQCYKSYNDNDYNIRLTQIIPQLAIEQK